MRRCFTVGGLDQIGISRHSVTKELKSYSAEEAAEFLHVSKKTVCRRVASEELVGYKPGRKWVFLEEDLVAYLKSTQPYIPTLTKFKLPKSSYSVPEELSPLAIRLKQMRAELRERKRLELDSILESK